MPRTRTSMTAEQHYLAFGGDRPAGFGLHKAQSEDGQRARAGVDYLLAQLRMPGAYAGQARAILQSCADPLDRPLEWAALMALNNAYWQATQPLLDYVRRAGGLSAADFEDGGREFQRLVFPSPAQPRALSTTPEVA